MFFAECQKDFKLLPKLVQRIREGVTLHRESVASSQRQRVRGSERFRGTETKEKDRDSERGDRVKVLRGTPSVWRIQFMYRS